LDEKSFVCSSSSTAIFTIELSIGFVIVLQQLSAPVALEALLVEVLSPQSNIPSTDASSTLVAFLYSAVMAYGSSVLFEGLASDEVVAGAAPEALLVKLQTDSIHPLSCQLQSTGTAKLCRNRSCAFQTSRFVVDRQEVICQKFRTLGAFEAVAMPISVECLHGLILSNYGISTPGTFGSQAFRMIHSSKLRDVVVSDGKSTLLADEFLKVALVAVRVVIQGIELIRRECLRTALADKVFRMPRLSQSFNHHARSYRMFASVALSSASFG